MKQRITLLSAVLILLAFLTQPLGLRGQNRTEVTDQLDRDLTGVTGSSYAAWSGVTSNSDAVYAGQSAGGNSSIQLRSNGNSSGIVTTASGGTLTSVSVTWNSNTADGRTLNVYGSNTAYSDPAELYSGETQGTLLGTIVKGSSTSLSISGNYAHVGLRSDNGAMYLQEIDITWSDGGGSTVQTVETPTFSPAGGTYSEAQTVTLSCATEGAYILYTTNGTNPTPNSTVYASPLAISTTTTVKAIAKKEGMNNSPVASATYTIQQQTSSITTIAALWDFAESVGNTATSTSVTFNDWYVTGVKNSQVWVSDGQYGFLIYQQGNGFAAGDKLNGTVTCDVLLFQNRYAEVTGVTATDLTVTSNQEVPVLTTTIGDLQLRNYGTAIDLGTLTYNGTAFVDQANASIPPYNQFNLSPNPITSLVSGTQYHVKGVSIIYFPNGGNPVQQVAPRDASDFEEVSGPSQNVATPTFTPAAGTYYESQSVSIACATQGATIHYTLDGSTPTLNSTVYTSPITIDETTTVKAMAVKEGLNDSNVATAIYTINLTPGQETTYTLITNVNALVEGEKYIIVGIKGEEYKALGKQNTNNRIAADVTSSNNVITTTPASGADDDAAFELTLGQEDGYWTFFDAVNGGYLYAASSSANYLRNQAENDANGQWSIEIAPNGVATIIAQGENTHNMMRLNNSGTPFSCYVSGQLDIYLYKAGDVPTPPPPTYYAITISNNITHGTVTASAQSAAAGETITVDAIPDDNYVLSSLTYSYAGANPVNIMQTMLFVMPSSDVTINATFTEEGSNEPITIAEARALATDTYALVQGVVTFIDGRNVYIQDETAGIDLFLNSNTVPENLALGDMVQAYGKRSAYNGLIELTAIDGSNATQFSILSSGNDLPVNVKTIAEILDDFNGNNMLQSTRVQIVEATIGAINTSNNTPITQDDHTINIYKIPVVEGLLEGDMVTVIGVVGCFNNPQLRIALPDDVQFTHPSTQTVATPTFSPVAGTYYETQNVTLACATEGATIYYTTDGSDPTPNSMVYSEAITVSETTTIKAYATKEDLEDSEIATAVYVITDAPVVGDYVRIDNLSLLGNGSKVIFAARYNENDSEYFAMTAQTSDKPEGVLFTSVSGNMETLPASITNEESTYYWTVTTDGNHYTFTNADGEMLGYTTGTNFSTGGDNINWTIEWTTSEASAMVPEYSAFVIANANVTNRAFALNSNHNFGPYHTQNMASENYNFFIDIFATEGGTPTCATPTFSPEAGTYFAAQTVTINCGTADATIYYTLDGSDPTPNSLEYTEPILVSENTTIKAIAMKEDFNDSNIAEAEYIIVIGAVTIFNQDWEGDMNGWTFVSVQGNKPWFIGEYNNNHYANANGYNGGANEQWCISPAFNLDACSDATLTFRNAMKFTGPDMVLCISNNYDGANPASATWTELDYVKSAGNYEWTESGTISLANFSGSNCYIGFKYISTETEAASWEIDDIVLMGFTSEPVLNITPLTLSGFSYFVDNGPSAEQSFMVSGFNLTGNLILSLTSDEFEMSDLSGDDFEAYQEFEIEPYNGVIEEVIYVRMAEGLETGSYSATIYVESELGDATIALSGTVMEQAQGGDWNRISSLEDLHDGDQVVIASRYDAAVNNGYYAMTAEVSGKPEGILFNSVFDNGTESLPDEIVMDIANYAWTVTVNGNVITLVNANGDALGYNSSTNFAGNESINWEINLGTSGENTMVPNYDGFVINNQENSTRCIAKNNNNRFGAYHTNNLNSAEYNFYLDLFVQGGSSTQTVATPTFSVASGTYYEAIDVEISCATQGATIYYTNDGSEPTAQSMVYEGAIHVDNSMTLKAIAMMEGFENSAVATANYNILLGQTIILSQDWEGEMNGWTFVSTEGNKPWTVNNYEGNQYAYANGYNDSGDNEQWCISPAMDLSYYDEVTLTFRNAKNYMGPDLELVFANDYDGHNPATASWQPLDFNKSNGNFVWTESGEIMLKVLRSERCHIAFRYTSTLNEGASVWQVDDIFILGTGYDNVNETTLEVNLWNHDNEIFVENHTNSNVQMRVFDLLGQQVLVKTIGMGELRFSHHLANGMYVVTLQNNEGQMSVKMVVK